MRSSLIIVGSSSYVLGAFRPERRYDQIVVANRSEPVDCLYDITEFVEYDLKNNKSNKQLVRTLEGSTEISVVFSSFGRGAMEHDSNITELEVSLKMNCIQPLDLFAGLMGEYPTSAITGVFLSSIYANVAPKPANYSGVIPINPLYYGVAKAGVQQGIRWLSSQRRNQRFNAIALGPMPQQTVQTSDPNLIRRLKQSMSSEALVGQNELAKAINFLLDPELHSMRGTTIALDGGYMMW